MKKERKRKQNPLKSGGKARKKGKSPGDAVEVKLSLLIRF